MNNYDSNADLWRFQSHQRNVDMILMELMNNHQASANLEIIGESGYYSEPIHPDQYHDFNRCYQLNEELFLPNQKKIEFRDDDDGAYVEVLYIYEIHNEKFVFHRTMIGFWGYDHVFFNSSLFEMNMEDKELITPQIVDMLQSGKEIQCSENIPDWFEEKKGCIFL